MMNISSYKKEVGLMKLENLIAARETVSTESFPIPDKELLSRFEQIYTGAVNDVLRQFCLLEHRLTATKAMSPLGGYLPSAT